MYYISASFKCFRMQLKGGGELVMKLTFVNKAVIAYHQNLEALADPPRLYAIAAVFTNVNFHY